MFSYEDHMEHTQYEQFIVQQVVHIATTVLCTQKHYIIMFLRFVKIFASTSRCQLSSEGDFVHADSTHSKYMKSLTNPIHQFSLETASTWLPLVNMELSKYHDRAYTFFVCPSQFCL